MDRYAEGKSKQYLILAVIFVVIILSLFIYYNRQKASAQDIKTSEEGKTQFPAGVVTPDVDKPDLPIQPLPTAPPPPSAIEQNLTAPLLSDITPPNQNLTAPPLPSTPSDNLTAPQLPSTPSDNLTPSVNPTAPPPPSAIEQNLTAPLLSDITP